MNFRGSGSALRNVLFLAPVVAAAMVVSACSGTSPATPSSASTGTSSSTSSSGAGSTASLAGGSAASFTMTIGDIEPYTGDLGSLGKPMDKADTVAISQLNSAAADAGLKVTFKLVTADTKTDPQGAILAAKKLVSQGASCFTGPPTTPVSIAVLNAVTKPASIPMFPTATAEALRAPTVNDNNTIFRVVPPDNLQAAALVDAVKDRLGGASGKLVSFAYQNQPYGEGLYQAFSKAWTAMGGRLQVTTYNPGLASYQAEAAKIVANSPDAWVFADFPDTFGKVATALLQTGKYDPSRTYVSDALAVSPIPSTIPKAALEGAFAVSAGSPTTTPEVKEFNTLYKNAPGGPESYSLNSNQFDATILCGLAAVAAQSNDPAKLVGKVVGLTNDDSAQPYTFLKLADAMKALVSGQSIRYVGASGPIHFGPDGDTTSGLYDLATFKGDELPLVRQITVG